MKKVGLVIARKVEGTITVASKIISFLRRNNIDIIIYPPVIDGVDSVERIEEINADFVISVGGDGTVLRTLLFIADKEIPILGIGMGEKNFLSITNPENCLEVIKKILRGDYLIKEEMRLEVNIENIKCDYPPVLNDILFASRITGKTCDIHVGITNKKGTKLLWHSKADGVIISTPIGSTAYSYSAGGPVIDTTLDGILIVPLVPVNPKPSILLNSNREIILWAGPARSPPLLVLDGQIRVEVDYLKKIYIRKSNKPARFIVIDDDVSLSRLIKAST